jgi:O-antigen/teichoic acid export membrane protein
MFQVLQARLSKLGLKFGFEQASLRLRALKGAVWTIGGMGTNQVIRLASNLALTRLLFPEAFGLMSLVQVFLFGLQMFSDIGVTPAIIHSKRGDEPGFLDTAWTISAGRGLLLWLGACAIAYPVSRFYREPMLFKLLPAVGITAFISGLNSTKLAAANRQLNIKRITIIELSTYVVSVIVTIGLAWMKRSIWALVIGAIVGQIAQAFATQAFLPGPWNRLKFDREAFRELTGFGRWIFVSSALGFVCSQGDRLLLGKLFDVRFLGIYSIALNLSQSANTLNSQLGSRILFPTYAELERTRPDEVYATLLRARAILLSVSASVAVIFVLLGPWLIHHMYDRRYVEAGWILQVLALSSLLGSVGSSYSDVLLARGKTRVLAWLIGCNIVLQMVGMIVGSHFGSRGVVVGLAVAALAMYPVTAVTYRSLKVWQPGLDGLAILVAALGAIFLHFR